MKQFVFRFQIILDRARAEEDRSLLRLAGARQELKRKEGEIARHTEWRRDALAAMAERQQRSFEAWEMTQHRLRLDAVAKDLRCLDDERDALRHGVEDARASTVAAMRKRQALEKLRERQLADYRRAAERRELRAMEDAAHPLLARRRQHARGWEIPA